MVEAFVNAELADAEGRFLSLKPFYLAEAMRVESDRVLTDDEGRFRIVGLRPGKYTVYTSVTTNGGERLVSDGRSVNYSGLRQARVMIPVYAPATFHKTDARVIEIKGSEQIADTQIELRLSALYTIRGKVLAKADRPAPNQAWVSLRDDTDKAFGRGARVAEDGSYEVLQVPPGTYMLTVSANDVADPDGLDQETEPVVLQTFDQAKLPVIVVDQDGVVADILLDEKKAEKK